MKEGRQDIKEERKERSSRREGKVIEEGWKKGRTKVRMQGCGDTRKQGPDRSADLPYWLHIRAATNTAANTGDRLRLREGRREAKEVKEAEEGSEGSKGSEGRKRRK